MWPFSSNDQDSKPKLTPHQQAAKSPGWYDEGREKTTRDRANYRQSTIPSSSSTDHPTSFLDPQDQEVLSTTSTSLRNSARNAAAPRGFIGQGASAALEDDRKGDDFSHNDPLFDSNGNFKPRPTAQRSSLLSNNAATVQRSHINPRRLQQQDQGNSDYGDESDNMSTNLPHSKLARAQGNSTQRQRQQQQHRHLQEAALRVQELTEAKFEEDVNEDNALWSKKVALKSQQPASFEEQIAPHDPKGKRLFRRFNTSDVRPDNLEQMYDVDADGLPTTAMSFGHWEGVPSAPEVRDAAIIDRSTRSYSGPAGPLSAPVSKVPGGDAVAAEESLVQKYGRPRSHVKQNLPPNVTKNGRTFTVQPPVVMNPEEFTALSAPAQAAYQAQLLDYQKFSFRGMNQQQRELMLVAQWDKLTSAQQEECREFQYLHLNFNTRKRVKHMTAPEREEFLQYKHFDQQRLFLLQPLSFEVDVPEDEIAQFISDDEEADFYLEGYRSPRARNAFTQGIDRIRDIRTQQKLQQETLQQRLDRKGYNKDNQSADDEENYNEYIVKDKSTWGEGNNDPDGLSSTLLDLQANEGMKPKFDQDGNPITNWQNVVRKHQENNTAPTEDELDLIKDQLRNLTPQQQFNILFRQHEKQLQELERFHNAQLKRATHLKMDQMQKEFVENGGKGSIPTKKLVPMIAKDRDMGTLRKRHNKQRSQLLKKQETEHRQLSQVLLVQSKAKKEQELKQHQLEVAQLRNRSNDPLAVDAQEDEIETELRLLNQLQPTFKSTGRPLEDEIAQKRKELLWRKQEQEIVHARKEQALHLAQMEEQEFDERNRLEIVRLLEESRERREMEYTLLKQRGKMIDLKMPINAKMYRPYHRYLNESTRGRDARAAYMYKTLGMLLFGVNVRWNGGIINGLLSTMVPVGKLPDQSSSNESQHGGYYVDIEHRNLDFSNLYNYYGVAASLYNPSIIPSFSHALYEDPDLDPMTNPNVIGFDEYERMNTENRRQGLQQQDQSKVAELEQSRFDVPLTASTLTNHRDNIQYPTIDPNEYQRIQQLKLLEYQQSHKSLRQNRSSTDEEDDNQNNNTQTQGNELIPLSFHQVQPQSIVDDPFLSTPALLPVNLNTKVLKENPFLDDRPINDIQLDDPEVDQWVESMLKFQQERKEFQHGVVSQSPEERRAEINRLLPSASFIDDQLQSQSQLAANLEQKLISSIDSGQSLQQIYNELVYNPNLTPVQKSDLFESLRKHQRSVTDPSKDDGSPDPNLPTNQPGIISPHELRARKENLLGRDLLEGRPNARHHSTSDQFHKTSMLTRNDVVNWDQNDLAAGGFDHPVFNKAIEMQMIQQKQRNNRGGSQGYKTDIDSDVEFFSAHLQWDSDSTDIQSNEPRRFGRENHSIGKKSNGLPEWSKDQQRRFDSTESNTDLEDTDPTRKLNSQQSRSYWANRTAQQQKQQQQLNNPSRNQSKDSHSVSRPFGFGTGSVQQLPPDLNLQPDALLQKHGIVLDTNEKNVNTNDADNTLLATTKGFFGSFFG